MNRELRMACGAEVQSWATHTVTPSSDLIDELTTHAHACENDSSERLSQEGTYLLGLASKLRNWQNEIKSELREANDD
ncbi:MAG: hypothetical protein KGL39_13725 [Patescibacteria group bacterium]|nr:hypothetical protein [Patescibacteria group bacterium]